MSARQWGAAIVVTAVALAGCTYVAFLRDDALNNTFAYLDSGDATRRGVIARFGAPTAEGETWVRYDSAISPPPLPAKRSLVVTFDDAGRLAHYRFTGVTGCTLPRAIGTLPEDESLAQVARPGATRDDFLTALEVKPVAVEPKRLAYVERKGDRMRARIVTFDEAGRFERLTRTALAVPDADTGAGADLAADRVASLSQGMTRDQVRRLLGAPQEISENVWGYCATAVGAKDLVVVWFDDAGRVKATKALSATGADAGQTATCYVCHKLSMGPTCLECHAFGGR